MNKPLRIIAFCFLTNNPSLAFAPRIRNIQSSSNDVLCLNQSRNPFSELIDMFQNFDDIIDDFMDKKMGNGEVFYGKRKYNPSGEFEGDYEGFGLTDFRKIEGARAMKEAAMERRLQREQQLNSE